MPEMTMRIIAGLVALAVLMWVEAGNAQTAYSLSVSRHSAVPLLSEGDVEQILTRASRMLQNNSKFPCNVTFTLKGPIRTFASPDTPVVNRRNIKAVHQVDSDLTDVNFHVKLVEQIRYCRPGLPRGLFEGCSYSPPDFRSMILVHPKLHKDLDGQPVSNYPDHLLWPHEFGHLSGLGHRRDQHGREHALMTPCSLVPFSGHPDTDVEINRKECRRLLSGPGAQAAPPFGCQ